MLSKDFLKKNFKPGAFVLGLVFTLLVLAGGDMKGMLYRTSVLNLPEHAAFDGTVYPVEFVPDYVKLTASERDYEYNLLPKNKLIKTPLYDAKVLKTDTSGMSWGDSNANAIRNAKITYSVPYMGTYKLDGLEYTGSHLAVDMKIPMRTPLRAIANGTVTKVSNKTTGFGKHVVIMHKDVPDPDRNGRLTTLYSSYSHNDENLVEVGDVVRKGEVIAYSGNTGTSTTPHVHFQLDNEKAPWHPFWAFTWQDSNAAGLSFFESVNAGLGYDKALETTEHPLLFVQKHLDGDVDLSKYTVPEVVEEDADESFEVDEQEVSSPNANSLVGGSDSVVEESSNEEVVVVEEEKDPAVFDRFEILVDSSYTVQDKGSFKVRVLDQYGKPYLDGFEGEISVKSIDGNASAQMAILTNIQFKNGVNENSFRRLSAGSERMEIKYKGETYRSDVFDVIDLDQEVAEFDVRVSSEGEEIIKVNENEQIFKDISVNDKNYEAFKFLYERGVITGYEDGTARPKNVVKRVEAAKIIVEALGVNGESLADYNELPFPDAGGGEWYSKYVKELYDRGVLTGTDEGLLLPNKSVNGAELMKMLLMAMEVDLGDYETNPWYQKYVIKARNLDIIDGGFDASKGMTRGEVADAMYRLLSE